jgi:hypothetical protein
MYVEKTPAEVEKNFASQGSPEDTGFKKRLEALRKLGSQCSGFHGAENPGILRLMAEAAALGYPPAVATTLFGLRSQGKGGEADQKAVELLQTKDPEVVERLIPYVLSGVRPDVLSAEMSANVGIVTDAWRLYSCSIGADCSESSRFLLERCWSESLCGATSVNSLFQDYKYSPSDYQELLRVRALIESSILQRNWRAIGLAK